MDVCKKCSQCIYEFFRSHALRSLGHTGRPRHAGPMTVMIYSLVNLGAMLRAFGIKQNLWFSPYSFTMCRGNPSWYLPVKNVARRRHRNGLPNYRVNLIFCVAGFRPGRRGPFLSGKGPKTIDAPSGLI